MAAGPRISLSRALTEGTFQTGISLRIFKLYLSAHYRVNILHPLTLQWQIQLGALDVMLVVTLAVQNALAEWILD